MLLRFLGKNYALNKPAFQSTTFVNDHGQSEAFYAVDGAKTDDTSTPHFTCAHTIDRHGWWYVDLEEEVVVGYIVVYIRTDETNCKHIFLFLFLRLHLFSIYSHESLVCQRSVIIELEHGKNK